MDEVLFIGAVTEFGETAGFGCILPSKDLPSRRFSGGGPWPATVPGSCVCSEVNWLICVPKVIMGNISKSTKTYTLFVAGQYCLLFWVLPTGETTILRGESGSLHLCGEAGSFHLRGDLVLNLVVSVSREKFRFGEPVIAASSLSCLSSSDSASMAGEACTFPELPCSLIIPHTPAHPPMYDGVCRNRSHSRVNNVTATESCLFAVVLPCCCVH